MKGLCRGTGGGPHLLEQKANEGPGVSLGLPGPSQEARALGTPESVPYRETEKSRLRRNPIGSPWKARTAGLADNFLFLVLAPAGTAGTALPHHSLAALMEDSSAFLTPDCGVKLKGKDDVMVVADLADEASLGAQVTVVDMLGGELN